MPINSFLLPGAKFIPAYEVANSCRFNDDDSAFLSKTFGGDGTHHDKGTVSFWLKRGELGAEQGIFTAGSSDRNFIRIESDDTLTFRSVTDSFHLQTTQVFRDSSAWYSIIIAYDTSQGTEGNRVKFYVNGTQVTSFGTETYPSQNLDIKLGAAELNAIGKDSEQTTPYLDGYLSEFVYIDGTQLTPTSFGEFDEDSPTIWKPIDVSGLTFGTNGFYLDFEDSGDLGDDESGNTNDFAETNLAATDQATDTPTNNFCTMNPLHFGLPSVSNAPLSNGNNTFTSSEGYSVYPYYFSTFAVSQGKWYVEFKFTTTDSATAGIGSGVADTYHGNNAYDYSYYYDGRLYNSGSGDSTGYAAVSDDDILGCALDLDNNKIYFHINGSYQASGDPANGTGGKSITAAASNGTGVYHFAVGDSGSTAPTTIEANFGNPPYTISSGNADADGYGNFEYAPPSGYYALCTKNLAEYG